MSKADLPALDAPVAAAASAEPWFETSSFVEPEPEAAESYALKAQNYYNLYRSFLAARGTLAVILLIVQANATSLNIAGQNVLLLLCSAYAAEALGLWGLHAWRHKDKSAVNLSRLNSRQWLTTIGFDLVTFTLLHFFTLDTALNYQALLALPVLMGGVLTRRLFALAVAASATLMLLFTGWVGSQLHQINTSTLLTQAGLTGAGLFVVALMANEMARRLAFEEAQARGSKKQAQQQADLNQLMIEELDEGVVVVDRAGWARAANPAARRLLAVQGAVPPPPFNLRTTSAWQAMIAAIDLAYSEHSWPEEGRDVQLVGTAGSTLMNRSLRLRIRFTQGGPAHSVESLCVLFLEDTRTIHQRIRTEKLAAMGRMSAGVAHEIRNPLASIAQANALLAEDATTPTQHQLTGMVADNVERLRRIVSDVLTAASGPMQTPPTINIAEQVETICREWQQTVGLAGDPLQANSTCALSLDLPHAGRGVLATRFDVDHFRRIIVNLLDNALRHGSGGPGSIKVVLKKVSDLQCRLSIMSDSAAISPQTERSLFEPFFSTRSQGTGLGLYISRQLSEQAGAQLEYRQRAATHVHRNEFFLTLALLPASAS